MRIKAVYKYLFPFIVEIQKKHKLQNIIMKETPYTPVNSDICIIFSKLKL
jgi:hypothetical protein